jgi:glycosyltransferase involved in cell wall biosynthesis
MRIAVIDFGSYAFTAQLARSLALRGHDVLYSGFSDYQGPKGAMRDNFECPEKLCFAPVSLGEKFHRYSYLKRRSQELRLGAAFAEKVRMHNADVVIGANMQIDVADRLQHGVAGRGIAYVHWLQDIVSLAMKTVLAAKLGLAGDFIASYYTWREKRLLQSSDGVVVITDDFMRDISGLSLDPARIHVIPNWAPLDELPVLNKDNTWSREHGFADKKVLLYSGSMGMKHNPKLIVSAAKTLASQKDTVVVVVAEGVGADSLAEAKRALSLDNLYLFPYQKIECLPEVLATADVLTALVDAEASKFCVPSKVLTYFCTGRPVLLAIASDNLAARMVNDLGLGFITGPDDAVAYAKAANRLLSDTALRQTQAANARRYAEHAFDITNITDRFEAILAEAVTFKKNSGH